MKFNSLRGVRETIGLEMERALGRNLGIWLWIHQICSLTEVFIQNSLILRRQPASFPTEVRVIRTATWCLQASLSTTRRRGMSSAIRGMFQWTPRTLVKSLGSTTIRQDGLAPALRFFKVSFRVADRFLQTVAKRQSGLNDHPFAHLHNYAEVRAYLEKEHPDRLRVLTPGIQSLWGTWPDNWR